MEPSNIQFLGAPCGQHGPYTFYKAFKYSKNGRTQILTLGEFFFVKILKDAEICIAELQLLWQDKNNEDLQLASARLYFLPEHTPDGRLSCHGEDELLAEAEKLVLSVEDMLEWLVDGEVCWPYGRTAVHGDAVTKGSIDLYCPSAVTVETDQLIEAFSANNAGVTFNQDVQKIKQAVCEQEMDKCVKAKQTEVVVLSFSQYCRYRAVLRRLHGCTNGWLKSALISAIGGFTVKSKDARIHFCRDTFDHPDLEDHEYRVDHLTPNLKGRPRKKRHHFKREWSLESDSNDSSEHAAYVPKRETRLPLGLQKKSNHIVHNYLNRSPEDKHKNEATNTNKKRRKLNETGNENSFLKKLHEFMRNRKSPIGRIPTLGFKEIDLYEFYNYAKRLGGYEQITSKRLWKHIYDKLGGNPSNTSAATCTRRHYERLLLPYELHLRGEEHKGLPINLNRKQQARGINNTVRNHLREKNGRAHLQCATGAPPHVKVETPDPKSASQKSMHLTNGRELSSSSPANKTLSYPLNVPKSIMVPTNKQESQAKNNVTSVTQAYVMSLPVSSSMANTPPQMLLPPGLAFPSGVILGVPQLPNISNDKAVAPPPPPCMSVTNLATPRPSSPAITTVASGGIPTQAIPKHEPPVNPYNVPTSRSQASLPPNVQVLPNGTILSTASACIRQGVTVPALSTNIHSRPAPSESLPTALNRPSVIHHTAKGAKAIMNPAPTPRPNIPQTVYGPPNVMPTPAPERSFNQKRSYQIGGLNSGLQSNSHTTPLLPNLHPSSHDTQGQSQELEVPVKRHRTDSTPRPPSGSFRPIVSHPPTQYGSIEDDIKPTDLSMKSSKNKVPEPSYVKPPSSEADTPLNLSLKAHHMPKTASVCVPKLPVNPFRPMNMSLAKPEPHGQRVDKPISRISNSQEQPMPSFMHAQRVDKPISRISSSQEQVLASSAHGQRVDDSINRISISQEQPRTELARPSTNLSAQVTAENLLALSSLPLVHPAFPSFPMSAVLPTSSSLPSPQAGATAAPTFSMATANMAPLLPPGMMAPPGMFFPNLSAYALSAVATQVYPHLYQPSSSSSSTNSSNSNNK